jgi:hypothetical protein
MAILLDLTAKQEERLRQAARLRGLYPDRLLQDVVDTALAQLEFGPVMPTTRIPDLHAGLTWVSEDFDAPLPDSFWLGEE